MLQEYYNHKELSTRMYEIVKDNKHTIASLSKEAGIPDSTLRNLCDSNSKFNPRLETLHKLSTALGFDIISELYDKD